VIALSRSYPCAMGGPVLNAVDPALFTLRYFTHCLACSFCGDACCDHGVDIDLDNVARLKALPKDFHDRVGAPVGEWFTGEAVADHGFPGGAHLRTSVKNGACVFRNAGGRGCAIHAYCLERKLDYHDYKPMVSVLFPVTFEQGVLTASSEVVDGSLICAGQGPSLYDGSRGELGHYFGTGLLAELDQLKARHG
jgi:Fe-S-cluster containining protein